MAIRVGINGFGRIGRLVVRIGLKQKGIEFVGVNDLVPSDNLAYLYKEIVSDYFHFLEPELRAYLLTTN